MHVNVANSTHQTKFSVLLETWVAVQKQEQGVLEHHKRHGNECVLPRNLVCSLLPICPWGRPYANCEERSMLDNHNMQIFCSSNRIPAFNTWKQPFSIPNVHLTSFQMDFSHFWELNIRAIFMIFSTAAQALTNSDNHCQQSVILRCKSVSWCSQMHHDHTIEALYLEVFCLHAVPQQNHKKSTTVSSFHLAGWPSIVLSRNWCL